MHPPKAAGPITEISESTPVTEQLGGPLKNSNTPAHQISQLRCELVGSNEAVAAGITGRGALDLCRRLIANGVDPHTELLCFRDGQLALRIRRIGDGARLTIRESAVDGPRFTIWKPFRHRAVAPSIRLNEAAVPSATVRASPSGTAV
jgi:hypothetical protein